MEHRNVVKAAQAEWAEQFRGEGLGHRRKQLGPAAGNERLGCSLYEVPPGRRAWPYHYHLANEEALYVLEGTGLLRIGNEEVEVSKGDYAALPTGPAGAHGISNPSDVSLRYLCFSTMREPDVMVYPDSDKVGIFAGAAPGGPKERRIFSKFLRGEAEVGYYEGEESRSGSRPWEANRRRVVEGLSGRARASRSVWSAPFRVVQKKSMAEAWQHKKVPPG